MDYKNKKIAITGYKGYIGSSLYYRLKENNYNVTPVDVDLSNCKETVEFFKDKNFDILFHLASSDASSIASNTKTKNIKDILYEREVNSSSILYLYKALKNSNTKIVFTSSTCIYGNVDTDIVDENIQDNPQSLWASHKILAENYLNILFNNSMCLRIPNIYGIDNNKHNTILRPVINKVINLAISNNRLTLYKNRECLRDYLHITDLLEALLLAGLYNGDKNYYVIGCDTTTTISNVWDIIFNFIPNVKKYINDDKEIDKIENRSYTADYNSFKKLTGWYSKITLNEGIKKTISYFKNTKNDTTL